MFIGLARALTKMQNLNEMLHRDLRGFYFHVPRDQKNSESENQAFSLDMRGKFFDDFFFFETKFHACSWDMSGTLPSLHCPPRRRKKSEKRITRDTLQLMRFIYLSSVFSKNLTTVLPWYWQKLLKFLMSKVSPRTSFEISYCTVFASQKFFS